MAQFAPMRRAWILPDEAISGRSGANDFHHLPALTLSSVDFDRRDIGDRLLQLDKCDVVRSRQKSDKWSCITRLYFLS
jgi:hypothetical protein